MKTLLSATVPAALLLMSFNSGLYSQSKTTNDAASFSNNTPASYSNSLSCSDGSNDCIIIIQDTGTGATSIPESYSSDSNQVILNLTSSSSGATGTIIKPFNNSKTQCKKINEIHES